MNALRRHGLAVVVSFAHLGWISAGCERSSAAPDASVAARRAQAAAEPIRVTVARVTPRTIERTVEIVGTLSGEEELTIAPKVEGRIARVLCDLGDVVRPGDVLLEIEDTELQLAVTEAHKAVEMELAKLGLKELPEGSVAFESIPTVVRAAAVEQNAALNLERAKSLSHAIVSVEELQTRESEHRVALAAHDVAMMEASATLAAARHQQAVLASAEDRLRETKVRAPEPARSPRSTGAPELVVAERLVSAGEMVRESPPTPAFRLVLDRSLKLKAPVAERHASRVRAGQKVLLAVESHPGVAFEGTIMRVSPAVDRKSRTFQIEASVPNEDRRLKAGSFAKASILTGTDEGVLTVPAEALVSFAGVHKVFTIEERHARAAEVKPGARIGSEGGVWLEVSGPIQAGAEVATSGHSKLVEGAPVRTGAPDAP